MIDIYKTYKPYWLIRIGLVNLIAIFFTMFNNETLEQTISRMIFTNVIAIVIYVMLDIATYVLFNDKEKL